MSCLNAPQWFRAQLLVEVSIGKMNNFCNFCDVASAKLKNLSGPTRNLKDLVPGFDHMFWGGMGVGKTLSNLFLKKAVFLPFVQGRSEKNRPFFIFHFVVAKLYKVSGGPTRDFKEKCFLPVMQ